jgi:hypothetical protein
VDRHGNALNGTISKAGLEDLFAHHFNEFDEDEEGRAAIQLLMVERLEENHHLY